VRKEKSRKAAFRRNHSLLLVIFSRYRARPEEANPAKDSSAQEPKSLSLWLRYIEASSIPRTRYFSEILSAPCPENLTDS